MTLHAQLYNWDISRFTTHTQQSHWNNKAYQRMFMDDLFRKLNLNYLEGWDKLTIPTLKQYGGSLLLRKYNQSLPKLFVNVYPEYKEMVKGSIVHMVRELKLVQVEDVLHVPAEYHFTISPLLLSHSHEAI